MTEDERMERDLREMEQRSAQVQADIDAARSDWARKQADDSVPGATGEPEDQEERAPWPDE
jgi:hypothetical protein